MRSIVRRLRGAMGTALTWAVGWGATAFSLMAGAWLVGLGDGPFLETAGPVSLLTAASGFIGGGVFSLVLGTVYRHRSLSDLRAGRVALWGAGAAILLPTLGSVLGLAAGVPIEPSVLLVSVLMIGVFGAATAGGMIKLAQAGSPAVEAGEGPDALTSGE